jgi:hypothetical protein
MNPNHFRARPVDIDKPIPIFWNHVIDESEASLRCVPVMSTGMEAAEEAVGGFKLIARLVCGWSSARCHAARHDGQFDWQPVVRVASKKTCYQSRLAIAVAQSKKFSMPPLIRVLPTSAVCCETCSGAVRGSLGANRVFLHRRRHIFKRRLLVQRKKFLFQ